MHFTFTKAFIATILALVAFVGAATPLDLIIWGLVLEVSGTVVLIFSGIAFAILIWAARDIAIDLLSLPVYSHDLPTPPTTDFNGLWQHWHAYPCYSLECHYFFDA